MASALVQSLGDRIRQLEIAGRQSHVSLGCTSSGSETLDQLLPGGGYSPGTLVEFLRSVSGSGASTLAMTAAKHAMRSGKYLVVIDSQHRFYAPAACGLGIDMHRTVVIHPERESDAIWALDQALRSSAVGAVWAMIDALDGLSARRLQLAAECGGGLGLLIRNANFRGPSWAEIQWRVQPRPAIHLTSVKDRSQEGSRWIDLHLQRCRGGRSGARVSVMLDGRTGAIIRACADRTTFHEGISHEPKSAVCLAAELAMPAHASTRSRPAQATVRSASA